MARRGTLLARLRRSRCGVAATEFALCLPVVLTLGLYGSETAWLTLAHLKVSQVAMQVADNASRIGDTSTLQNRRIYESDINDILAGANLHGGGMLKLLANGRVIISSLEVQTAAPKKQYIHWQRCKGALNATSTYGAAGDVLNTGMGPAGREVSAFDGEAVIFVEVAYTYQPLVSASLIGSREIRSIASFNVRDSRDLSQIYQQAPAAPVASCSVFSAS